MAHLMLIGACFMNETAEGQNGACLGFQVGGGGIGCNDGDDVIVWLHGTGLTSVTEPNRWLTAVAPPSSDNGCLMKTDDGWLVVFLLFLLLSLLFQGN